MYEYVRTYVFIVYVYIYTCVYLCTYIHVYNMFILYMCILCICISINVGFPGGTSTKEPPASARDVRDSGSVPGLGRSLEEGMAIHYSCLKNLMDRGAWWATVHRVTKSWT